MTKKESFEKFVEWSKEKLPTIKGNNFLEIGCSDGWKQDSWSKYQIDVQGMDIDEKKVNIVRDMNRAAHVMDMEKMDKDNYSAIFCFHILELSKKSIFDSVDSMLNALAEKGRLYIATGGDGGKYEVDIEGMMDYLREHKDLTIIDEKISMDDNGSYWVVVEKETFIPELHI